MADTQKQRWAARAERYELWASKAESTAAAITGNRNDDHAFLTQPAARGSKLYRDRAKMHAADERAWELAKKAERFRDKAKNLRFMVGRNAGDAARERAAKIDSCSVVVGQIVKTTHYGPRKVIKVNAKTVLVEGAFGPLKIEKQFIAA